MTLTIEIVSDHSSLHKMDEEWDELVVDNHNLLDGLDATSGAIWFSALSAAFPPVRQTRFVILRKGQELIGLMPLMAIRTLTGGVRLTLATSMYGGRNGFMLKTPDVALLNALLQGIGRAFSTWESLTLLVVDGGHSDQLLCESARQLGMKTVVEMGWQSPFFPLHSNQKSFNSGISKSLKQTIRTSKNRLQSLGELRFVEIADALSAEAALEAVLAVERSSWKQTAGTAITCNSNQESFYRALFPQALRRGLLYGNILYLNDIPIAYNFGLIRSGVFSCLKHSNREEYQSASPSQLLNSVHIDRLRDRGVAIFDFMGKAEPHKLRWSSQTGSYGHKTVRAYSTSAFGTIAYAVARLKSGIRGLSLGKDLVGEPAKEPK